MIRLLMLIMPRHYLLDQLNKKLKKVCHKILPIIVSYVEAASDIANNLREDFMMRFEREFFE